VVREPTAGLSEEVERRTELRELLADLDHLPERQKTALVLSEAGALDHAQVAQVLECETKQVKALVFQARSALIEDRRARETPCAEIREQLATASARELRRSSLRRHVRVCAGCAEFRDEVRRQRRMLAVALPVVPSFGLKESALAAAGIGGGGAAGGGGLMAALGAQGAAKTAAIAIATGGALGGAAVAVPELVSKAQGEHKEVRPDARGGASGASVSRRQGTAAGRANGSFDSDAAPQRAAEKGRRREANAAADKDSPSRERPDGDGPARPRPKDRRDGQSQAAGPRKDRGRGRRGTSARSKPKGSPRRGADKSRGRKSSKPPKLAGNRGRRRSLGKKRDTRPKQRAPLNRGKSRARSG
jgi:hypothetical protein